MKLNKAIVVVIIYLKWNEMNSNNKNNNKKSTTVRNWLFVCDKNEGNLERRRG